MLFNQIGNKIFHNNLGEIFKELGYKVGVELGVEQGVFSEILCKGNPDMLLYGVDAWDTYEGYREHVTQEKLDGFYDNVIHKMQLYNYSVIRGYSMDIVDSFDDGELDFVYIDANHTFPHFSQDLYYWEKKVRVGGMIAGHDYRKFRNDVPAHAIHVVYVVNAFTQSYKIHPWFLLGSKNKVPGMIRDNTRSWFWIKE